MYAWGSKAIFLGPNLSLTALFVRTYILPFTAQSYFSVRHANIKTSPGLKGASSRVDLPQRLS